MGFSHAKMLFDLANDEAKKLQKKQGRTERGIVSTQVQGLIIALGTMMDKIPPVAEKKK